ncbi:syntaxin, putative [Trypanosoma equiperdum]|uniref:Syntaxin, putative n=2 Tax=Trypanozoon TaxID=39700 RepID=Q38C59_TRYB2|nr:syntaxin, putative [Trypanosoma brucei brucei TREU927]EAN77611.1 syntaxin, putative [Trypanosoma brucei brucei TREU927]SCU66915.1 syntaxin, putative [Trypanosoma equiperdum]
MSSLQDPFDESVSDVRELIVKARSIREAIQAKGLIASDAVTELGTVVDSVKEELMLLNDVLRVIEQKNGRVGEEVLSVNEVVRRQTVVRELEIDLKDICAFREFAESRVTENDVSNLDRGPAEGSHGDTFYLRQERVQREEQAQQDVILDRLSHGLQELRETGINVNDELQQQDNLLSIIQVDVEGVQARLRVVNAKVDKMLADMSSRSKICSLLGLALVALLLFYCVFS